jgi:dTDP-4-dehydrorhamnose 3,5-epimerase
MKFIPQYLGGSYLIETERKKDDRGWFTRTWCKDEFSQIGHTAEWVQHNHTLTIEKGSLRGLHYQLLPFAETKLVRCVVGSVYDVIVDIRKDSPTYLQYLGVELSSSNGRMLYIPEGFAHGFQTLEPNCEMLYCHSAAYKPGFEGGLHFSDPSLKIQWPLEPTIISDRDKTHPFIDNTFQGLIINI